MNSRIWFLKKHKSIKSIDNKQGSIMAMAIASIAALIILASMFIVSTFYNFRLIRTISYSESAYLGAEAAAEKWYGILRNILTHEDARYIGLDFPNDYGKEAEYVLSVLERIRVYGAGLDNEDYHKELHPNEDEDLINLLTDDEFKPEFRVIGEHERIINVEFGRFEVYDARRAVSTVEQAEEWGLSERMQIIQAKVGFVLVARVENESGNIISDNNRIFVQKEILIPYYEQIQAIGAIYSIGDVVAIGDGDKEHDEGDEIKIIGDVYSFGTFPKRISVPEQWAFGGVMARQGARLNILGNVLTRSFLRAGDYDEDDDARIVVQKDVMAQNIQSFSRGSRLYIYGNAYTLDDLEINAEDSIIAINGNYIGLEAGFGASFHDQTSSILNSGAVHERNRDPTKSRIVINGDIIVPGINWRIDSSGVAIEQLESVGVIFPDEDSLDGSEPADFFVSSGIPSFRHTNNFGDGKTYNNYMDFLMNKNTGFTLNHLGYANIIQAWDPKDNSTDLGNWKVAVNDAIDEGNNYGNKDLPDVDSISGLVVDIAGANNSIYWDEHLNRAPDSPDSGKNQFPITGLSNNLTENFRITGFMPSEIKMAFDNERMDNWVRYEDGLKEFDFNQETMREALDDKEDIAKEAIDGIQTIEWSLKRFWENFWKPWDADNENEYPNWDMYMRWSMTGDDSGRKKLDPNDDAVRYRELLLDSEDKIAHPVEPLKVSRRGVLKELIENRLNKIAERSFPDSAEDEDPWDTSVNDDLEHLFKKIEILKQRVGSDVIHYYQSSDDRTLPDELDNRYHLVAIDNSNADIIINDTFNGIIVTRGRVTIQRGGVVNGAIFAGGRNKEDEGFLNKYGDNNNLTGIPTANANIEALNDGDFAGVILDLTEGSGDPPRIDFYLGNYTAGGKFDSVIGPQRGRIQLLDRFRKQTPSVDLYQIF